LLQPINQERVQPLRLQEVLQPVQAKVSQPRSGWQAPLDQRPGGVREQDLTAVRRGGDPRGPVHVQPQVVVPAQGPLAGVQPHPDLHGDPVGPGCRRELALGLGRRADGAGWRPEHREERVPLGGHFPTVALGDGGPEDGVVAVLDVPVPRPQPLQQPGGSLDVGKQEGDGPDRQVLHVRSDRNGRAAVLPTTAAGGTVVTGRPARPRRRLCRSAYQAARMRR
jgi:hypothetical protein